MAGQYPSQLPALQRRRPLCNVADRCTVPHAAYMRAALACLRRCACGTLGAPAATTRSWRATPTASRAWRSPRGACQACWRRRQRTGPCGCGTQSPSARYGPRAISILHNRNRLIDNNTYLIMLLIILLIIHVVIIQYGKYFCQSVAQCRRESSKWCAGDCRRDGCIPRPLPCRLALDGRAALLSVHVLSDVLLSIHALFLQGSPWLPFTGLRVCKVP